MANKLHLAALSSLKSEIQDLTGQLKAVTQERDFLERSLSKAQLEKLRLVHDAEERLDSQAQRYEGRLTELHCVIAELSRKIRGQTSRVITEEEEEEDESTTTAADDEDDEEGGRGEVEEEEEEEEEDGAGSQSVAADTTQDDLSGVGGEEEGVETETQDCCELESGRTELVDGEGTVVPDDATDHTHIQDLSVVEKEEEEGLEQQRRLHRKVKELQGNLQQLQIITPSAVVPQSPPPLEPKQATVPHGRPRPVPCCSRGGRWPQGDSPQKRAQGSMVPPAKHEGCQEPRGGLLPSLSRECHAANITASEMVDLGVCCNSRTAEHLVRDIREESSAQELQLAARCGGNNEGGDGAPVWAGASNKWGRRAEACQSSIVVRLQMESSSPPVGEQGIDAPPCSCLPILRALELEVERQAGRAESHRASAELAFLSLDECRCACERQALLLGRRGSDIVGLATAISYALPLCRATYVLSRLLHIQSQEAASRPGTGSPGSRGQGQSNPMPKGHAPEPHLKGSERSHSKRRHSSRGSPSRSSEPEKSWLCRKREELGKSWGSKKEAGEEASPPMMMYVVDEGGGYGKINRAAEEGSSTSSGSMEAVVPPSGTQRVLEMEVATLVESLDQKMRLLDMSQCRAEDVAKATADGAEDEREDWVLSNHDFQWLESLGVEEEDGSPDMLRRLCRHISTLLRKLSSCGISLHKARAMAAEASALEGELPPHMSEESHTPHPTAPSSSLEDRKADLEVAVLMQELMAMREERAALRVRLHALEGEREELGRLCQLLKPNHGRLEAGSGTSPQHTTLSTKDILLSGKCGRQTGDLSMVEADSMTTSREQWLEGRLQELALALEQVATSADVRLRQSTAVMNDLRRTNGTLAHSLERCRRRYQQRLKTLEGQMENLVERHASQVRTLRQRIGQLEEKGGSCSGAGRGEVRCSSGTPLVHEDEVPL
ncbi:colorectal mutant cancer protein [Hetaerina americana]|uniref:colorectal mutant cancer protein n=1 Tax=Hetaerina americana TaxID=62018 RepID=UPI003A7F36B7